MVWQMKACSTFRLVRTRSSRSNRESSTSRRRRPVRSHGSSPHGAAAGQLVDHGEAVLGVEVDEEQGEVLERRVGHRDEERRARPVGVPGVEGEEPGLAVREVGAPLLEANPLVAEPGEPGPGALLQRPGRRRGRSRARAVEVQAVVVGPEQVRRVRVARARPGASLPAVHPRQAVLGQVAEGQARVAGAGPDQVGLLQLAQRQRRVARRVGQRPSGQRHAQAEAPRAARGHGVGQRVAECRSQPLGDPVPVGHRPSRDWTTPRRSPARGPLAPCGA